MQVVFLFLLVTSSLVPPVSDTMFPAIFSYFFQYFIKKFCCKGWVFFQHFWIYLVHFGRFSFLNLFECNYNFLVSRYSYDLLLPTILITILNLSFYLSIQQFFKEFYTYFHLFFLIYHTFPLLSIIFFFAINFLLLNFTVYYFLNWALPTTF